MLDIKKIPPRILSLVRGREFTTDTVGESDSEVYIFDDSVLKVQKTCAEADNEFNIMQWLNGRLPVPEIIEFERKDGYNFLLMSRLGGLS